MKSQYFRGVVTWMSQSRIKLIAKPNYKARLSESWARRFRVTKSRGRLSQLRPRKIYFRAAADLRPPSRAESATADGSGLDDIKKSLYLIVAALSDRAPGKFRGRSPAVDLA
jgi:hypothetical protein